MSLLAVQGLQAGYGASQVLFGIGLDMAEGEVVTLLGRNGMGKSTTIKCLTGMLAPSGGSIVLRGKAMAGAPSYKIARAGVGLVPEGRQVFPELTVLDNIRLGAFLRRDVNPADVFAGDPTVVSVFVRTGFIGAYRPARQGSPYSTVY